MQQAQYLPFIDENILAFDAPSSAVWSALLYISGRETNGSEWLARVLGCDPSERTSAFTGLRGQTIPGFRVTEADPEHRLVLRGHHRFATYALTIVLDGELRRAETRATFPGVLGKLYQIAVIGMGIHRIVTRRLLRRVVISAYQRLSLECRTASSEQRI